MKSAIDSDDFRDTLKGTVVKVVSVAGTPFSVEHAWVEQR